MRFVEFRETFRRHAIFSLEEIRGFDPGFHRRRLNEWQDKGYIKKLRRGWYVFSDLEPDEALLFEAANRIYSPSYVSLEMALSYHNLIPEGVYAITSVSTRKTVTFQAPLGDFIYRTVKPGRFFGYSIVEMNSRRFNMADVEKSLLDFFYINRRGGEPDGIESLRMDREMYQKKVNRRKLRLYTARYADRRLNLAVKQLEEHIRNA